MHRRSSSRPATYTLRVEGLRLPSANDVIRWHHWQRTREVRRVRHLVETMALVAGLGDAQPLSSAHVTLRVRGLYRTDLDNLWIKDALDAIVARPLRLEIAAAKARLVEANGGVPMRRWGLVLDDRPDVIGKPEVVLEEAQDDEVVVEVTDVSR